MKAKIDEVTVVCSEEERTYRKELFNDVSTVLNCRLFCTCCIKDVKNDVLIKDKVYIHPFFQVLVCKDCLKFYGDGEIPQDEDGSDKYCRWCGQGGYLNICSDCPVAICKGCVNRNLNRASRKEVAKDNWKCFRCQPKPLYELRAQAWAVKTWLKSKKKSEKEVKEKPKVEDMSVEGQLKMGLDYEISLIKEVQKACRSSEMKLGGITRRKELVNKSDLTFEKIDGVSLEISNHIKGLISTLRSHEANLASYVASLGEKLKGMENKSVDTSIDLTDEAEKNTERRHSLSEEEQEQKDNGKKSENNLSKKSVQVESDNEGDKTDSVSNGVVNGSSIMDVDEILSDNEQNAKGAEDGVPVADLNVDNSKNVDANEVNKNGENYEVKTETFPKLTLRIRKVEEVIQVLQKDQANALEDNTSEPSDIIELDDDDDDTPPELIEETDNTAAKGKQKEENSLSDNNILKNTHDSNNVTCENITTEESNKEKSALKRGRRKSSVLQTANNTLIIIKDKSSDEEVSIKRKTYSLSTKGPEEKKTVEADPSPSSNLSGDVFSDQDNIVVSQVISSTSTDNSSEEETPKKAKSAQVKTLRKQMRNSTSKVNNSSSDTDSDIERLLDMKSLTSKKMKSEAKERTTVKKDKEETKKASGKQNKEKTILDYCDEESDDSVIDLRAELYGVVDLKRVDRDSMFKMLKTNQFSRVNEEPLSSTPDLSSGEESSKSSVSSGDTDDLLIDSDDERKSKAKKKNKNSIDTEVKENDLEMSSDDSEDLKESKSSKQKKDKLLSLKLSDDSFDDSDSDGIFQSKKSSKSDKRSKKKIHKVLDSDEEKEAKNKNSSESSDSEALEEETPAKKRKRIKNASSSSDEEEDVEGSGVKGRKNIRKVLKKDSLQASTQNALKEEEDRKKRIAERQKLYNQMLEECEAMSSKVDKLVLDFDVESKEELLSVDKDLVAKLKPHQAEGIKFMWDSTFETIKKAKKSKGSGCILAHCMGLGKTLQVISLIHTLTANDVGVKCALVLCPLSTVLNWVHEFEKWLSDIGSGQDVDVFHMTKINAEYRANQLREWQRRGGVMILAYNLFRLLVSPTKRIKAAHKKAFFETLCDPGPDVVFCDEGHLLKNEKTALSQAVQKIKTLRRIVLTGTPLQNNLIEYHCMMQFVKPKLLGTKKEFVNRFVSPIENGQFVDSTPQDVRIMKRRAHVLHKMLDGLVQRKAYNVLIPFLPTKHEYVLSLSLTDVQVNLYRHYLDNLARNKSGSGTGASLFKDKNMLSLICAHPRLIVVHNENELMKRELEFSDEEGSLKDFIDDSTSESESSVSSEETSSNSDSSSSVKMVSKKKTRNSAGPVEETPVEEEKADKDENWWSNIIQEGDMEDIGASSKLQLFFTILQKCEEIGDKLLLFSQSLLVLDLIEYFLEKVDTQSQKDELAPGLRGFGGSWSRGIDYFRLDGKTSSENRASACRRFNSEDNLRARLFLISTRAGGLGINLTGANRVILFDASWNPSHDVQSIFRVYRFGQSKPCYIYRFLNKGTMEQKVYDRQVTKLSMSCRVIDEQQIDRHFSFADLNELYTFTPNERDDKIPSLPKDRMLAELLQEHKDLVLGYHTHDSLLENQLDEELNEEERKQAWADFEHEKNPPPNEATNNYAETFQRVYRTLKEKYSTWSEVDLRQATFTVLSKMNAISGGNIMQGYQTQVAQQQFMQQQPRGKYVTIYPKRPEGVQFQSQPQFQGQPRVFNNVAYVNPGVVNNPNLGRFTHVYSSQPSLVNNTYTNVQQPSMVANPYALANNALPNPFNQNAFTMMMKGGSVANPIVINPLSTVTEAQNAGTSTTKPSEQPNSSSS